MKTSFEKNEDDFGMTDKMAQAIEAALKQDTSQAVDGKESLKRIRSRYGL